MTSDTDEQSDRRTSPRGANPIVVLVVVGGGFIFGWFVAPLAEDFPLLRPLGALQSLALFVGTFVVVGAAVLWLRRKKLSSPVDRVVSVVVAVFFGGVAALATMIWLFPILNGALDFGPATRQTYVVARFVPDERDANGACPGSRTIFSGDDSHYILEPREGDGPIEIGVDCDDERGLPTDGGEVVPIDGEVAVDVKAGLFGKQWLAGVQAPPGE